MGVIKASDDAGRKGFIECEDLTDGKNIWTQLHNNHSEKVKMNADPVVAARRVAAQKAILLEKKEAKEAKEQARLVEAGLATEKVMGEETVDERAKRRAKEKEKKARDQLKVSKHTSTAGQSKTAFAAGADLPGSSEITAEPSAAAGPSRSRSRIKSEKAGGEKQGHSGSPTRKSSASPVRSKSKSKSVAGEDVPDMTKKKSKGPERRSKSPERRISRSPERRSKSPEKPKRKASIIGPFQESTASSRLRKGLHSIDEVSVYRHQLSKKLRKEQTQEMDGVYLKRLEDNLVNGFSVFQHSLLKDKQTGRHLTNSRMALFVRMNEDHDCLVFSKGGHKHSNHPRQREMCSGQSLRVKFSQITKVQYGPFMPALRTRDPFLDPEYGCCSIILKSGVSMDLSFESSSGSLALVLVTKAKADNCAKVAWKHVAGLRWHVARMRARTLALQKHCSFVKILVTVIQDSAKSFDFELKESYGSSLVDYCQWKHEKGVPAAVHLARSSVDMVGADFSLHLALAQGLLLSEAVFNLPLDDVLDLLDKPLSKADRPHLKKVSAMLNRYILYDVEHRHNKETKKLQKKQDAMRGMKNEVRLKQIQDLETKHGLELDKELTRLQEKSLLWVLEVKDKAPEPIEIFCHRDRRYVEIFTRVLQYFAGAIFSPVWESHSLEVKDLPAFIQSTPRPVRRPLKEAPVFPAGSNLRVWRTTVPYPPIFATDNDGDVDK
jgi:hypothetical protein